VLNRKSRADKTLFCANARAQKALFAILQKAKTGYSQGVWIRRILCVNRKRQQLEVAALKYPRRRI
jgi:hypothetical protein